MDLEASEPASVFWITIVSSLHYSRCLKKLPWNLKPFTKIGGGIGRYGILFSNNSSSNNSSSVISVLGTEVTIWVYKNWDGEQHGKIRFLMKSVYWTLKLIVLHFPLLCSKCRLCIKKDTSLRRVSTKPFSVWLTLLLNLPPCCSCCNLLQLHEDCMVRINY